MCASEAQFSSSNESHSFSKYFMVTNKVFVTGHKLPRATIAKPIVLGKTVTKPKAKKKLILHQNKDI